MTISVDLGMVGRLEQLFGASTRESERHQTEHRNRSTYGNPKSLAQVSAFVYVTP
jgi:hypothetical protein